jgi:small subunit ribosomal protein S1
MVWMNDDQMRQPEDTQDATEAQDSSEGDNDTQGTQDMGSVSDTGNDGNTETSDVEAPPMRSDGESAGDDSADQVDGYDAATVSSDTPAAEDEQTPAGEDTSGMTDMSGSSMDMLADESSGGEDVSDASDTSDTSDTSEVPDMSDASMDMPADVSADTGMEAPDEPQMAGADEPADEQPSRPPRPQYGSDEAPSDEMVIHTARDPRMDDIASNASMEDLMKASERQYRPIKHGDVIEGTVMKVGRDEIMIDIGGKTEGVISSRESTSLTDEEREALQIGDTLLVSVVQPHNSEGQAVLSLDRARQEKAWRDLQRAFEAGETISAPVVGHNKGGILVNIEGIRGFVPSSQVSSLPPGEANKQAEMARLHNQSIPLKIIEINRHRNRLILSERQAMQEQRESMRARLLLELQSGQIRPGTVTSVCDFGAFVDIGGADGLIHLSELSWKRVSHPSEVLKVGDRVNVYVLSVDQHERKIALSLKRTQPEPWETITDQYQLGQLVKGTITQITTFGAFARLEDGIEGLIHVSELAEGRVAHPRNVVKEGEQLELKVIRIDPARKRIGLSLKRVNEDASRADEGAEGEAPETRGAEDAGMEGAPSAPPQQSSMPEQRQEPRQESRPPRQAPQGQGQQRQQGQRPPRPQQQAQQPLTSQSEDFEHLGAFAQALAAHTQQATARPEDEGGAQEEATSPTPAEETAPGEVVGSLSGVNTSADMDATSAMGESVDEAPSDTGDDMPDQGGGADSLPGDKSDTTATAPEMGAFGTDESESTTDEATDSGDTASKDEEDSTDDTSTDTTVEAGAPSDDAGDEDASGDDSADATVEVDASSGDAGNESGDDSSDEDASESEEPQAMMPSTADASDSDTETEDTEETADTDAAAETTTTSDTDVATDSGDMPAEEPEASMPSSESVESADSTDTGSEDNPEEVGDDSAASADTGAEEGDTSSTSDSGDDADSGAPSGSEGEPSTADSEASDEGSESKDEKDQG